MSFFCFHDDYYELAKTLPKKYRGEFLEAIAAYVFEGVELELKGVAKTLFESAVKKRLDTSDAAKERKKAQRERERDSKTEDVTNGVTDSVTVTNGTGKGIGKENKKEKKEETMSLPKKEKFTPPSVEEVKSYFKEKSLSGDPEHFHDHFVTQGWKLSNGNAMKDWRKACNNWSRYAKTRFKDSTPKGGVSDDDLAKYQF